MAANILAMMPAAHALGMLAGSCGHGNLVSIYQRYGFKAIRLVIERVDAGVGGNQHEPKLIPQLAQLILKVVAAVEIDFGIQ